MQNYTETPTAEKCISRLANRVGKQNHKNLVAWTLEKLDISPYQHILEIGYGSGYALSEVGRVLRVGFIAGVDHSAEMQQQAYRRNRNLIKLHMLDLHVGEPQDLPYPNHYFHRVYGINVLDKWKDPLYGFLQLSRYLKSAGSLLMMFQTNTGANERRARVVAENIRQQFATAGLQDVEIDFQFLETCMGIAVKGFKE